MNGAEYEYCRLRIGEKMARADAFIKAFSKNGMDRVQASKNASRLEKKPEIVGKMGELARRIENEAILSRQELMKRVLARAESAEKDADALRGYELYGKLAGFTAPEVATQVNVVQCSFASVMAAIQQSPQSP